MIKPDAGRMHGILLFLLALSSGTLCSLISKGMMSMNSYGLDGNIEEFSYPLFQTFGMFLGMAIGLILHWIVLKFRIPFPGYDHHSDMKNTDALPSWIYFSLVFPSVCDLFATAFFMVGLQYVDVSVYQMLRGGSTVFVAVLKQYVLKHSLKKYMWIGIMWNVISIILVGFAAVFSGWDEVSSSNNPTLGVCLILTGAAIQSLQYVL